MLDAYGGIISKTKVGEEEQNSCGGTTAECVFDGSTPHIAEFLHHASYFVGDYDRVSGFFISCGGEAAVHDR